MSPSLLGFAVKNLRRLSRVSTVADCFSAELISTRPHVFYEQRLHLAACYYNLSATYYYDLLACIC